MPRTFTQELHDLPPVDVADWELFERLDALLEPYLPANQLAMAPRWEAHDSRGSYTARNIEHLRKEASKQTEPPHTIRVSFLFSEMGGTTRFVNVFVSSTSGSGGRIRSGDEQLAGQFAAKVRALFGEMALDPVSVAESTDSDDAAAAATRIFDETLDDLPQVDFPNWDLLSEVLSVVIATRPKAAFTLRAHDPRGQYTASDVASLRSAVDAAPYAPHALDLFATNGPIEELSVRIARHQPPRARVVSQDEMFVDHFLARVADTFQRRRVDHSSERSNDAQVTNSAVPASRSKPDRGARAKRFGSYLYDHYVKAIITAVVAALVVALVLIALGVER